MKTCSFFSLVSILLVLAACSRRPESQIAGAQWLDEETGGGMHDVLMYPLNEDELLYLESILPVLEEVGAAKSKLWEEIAVADDPVWAASRDAFWDKAGLLGQDVMAVTLKLTFLWEFDSMDESVEDDMRESLQFIEERLQADEANSELLETANSMRAILNTIEAHKEAGAFDFYEQNKKRIDAALDRFTSIGEQ